MRPLLIGVLATATAFASGQSASPPPRELDNVAAFARLYGVVRYFYPSDAATGVDWDRFAVDGVQQVRTAVDRAALESTLERLFQPLGPGIEIGVTLPSRSAPPAASDKLVAWRYLGPGIGASGIQGPYQSKRTNRARTVGGAIDGFVTLMQTLPAATLAGKAIRLRGQVRANAKDSASAGALWLRVDRPDRAQGFFDNMGDRPIRDPEWREYVIEGKVADDAMNVAFGIMAYGNVAADFDAIGLSVRDGDAWSPVAIKDPGFEDAGSPGWMRAGNSKIADISRPEEKAPEGRLFARLSAPSPKTIQAELFDEGAPTSGDSIDADLGDGLKARIPLALSETEAAGATSTPPRNVAEQADLDVRLADVVIAWNVFRHFYPYWSEVGVDWDARLRPQLARAYSASTRDRHREALRLMVAEARDGHGGVNDMRSGAQRASLPVRLIVADGQVVVSASGNSAMPLGTVVSSIDGVPARQRLEALMRLSSGSTQWTERRALQEMTACSEGADVTLLVDSGTGPRKQSLRCETKPPPAEERPQPIAELSPNVWYVDITRATMGQITPALEKLSKASGVVFDLRGYPTDAGAQVLPHLIGEPENDRWMHIAKITGPFGRSAGWQSMGWNLNPATPRVSGKIVFLTDGRAISYAESVMGYVGDRKLATIVGAATAGANGNVQMFTVPGRFNITFTGMRVTSHDGKTPFHTAGIKPDVPVAPTIAGLRAGRDEVLERALKSLIPNP